MSKLFILQITTSMIVGGFFVAFQTLLAERVPQRIAGIVMSIPSTIAIGLVFMALTISPSAVAAVAPVLPASFGITLVFVTLYVYLANFLQFTKAVTLVFSTLGAVTVWFLLASPLAYFKIDNLAFSFGVYAVLVAAMHYLLAVKPKIETQPITIRYTPAQKVLRAVIGGVIIGLTVFFAKTLGPFWGGIFTAFPAVYLSTLLIVHYRHGKEFLFHIAKTLPIASPIFIIYAFVVQYTYPLIGITLGTLAAYAVCAVYPLTVSIILNHDRYGAI